MPKLFVLSSKASRKFEILRVICIFLPILHVLSRFEGSSCFILLNTTNQSLFDHVLRFQDKLEWFPNSETLFIIQFVCLKLEFVVGKDKFQMFTFSHLFPHGRIFFFPSTVVVSIVSIPPSTNRCHQDPPPSARPWQAIPADICTDLEAGKRRISFQVTNSQCCDATGWIRGFAWAGGDQVFFLSVVTWDGDGRLVGPGHLPPPRPWSVCRATGVKQRIFFSTLHYPTCPPSGSFWAKICEEAH